ncbi:TPA: hypothetical protein PFE21_004472 [Kluyvera ascorbata]|uniref:hypothetical protein n=1 Tax=Kluyvera ascorbata TaxID=51288 RepID=UPI00290FBF24|nr:hypothetical protein [Kluyvera ascorbata]MDU3912050.1 hypothetical protein [Kluyvera ascorbata]HDG1723121.1 hypothetical protein [Kluyvera ascorbata]
MSDVKIYTVMSDELSPPITGDAFCTDMVRASDYAALEQQLAAVVATVAALKNFIKTDCYVAHVEPETFYEVEVTRYVSADGYEPETSATDAFLAEVRAQGVEMFASHLRTNDNGASVCKMIALGADEFAAQLRQGAEYE